MGSVCSGLEFRVPVWLVAVFECLVPDSKQRHYHKSDRAYL